MMTTFKILVTLITLYHRQNTSGNQTVVCGNLGFHG